MSHLTNRQAKPEHAGLRLRSPAKYDRLVWLLTWGRPRRLRERMLRPAGLKRGEHVLDVSCGTGSLALLAKQQVGTGGQVHGVDASEEMIAYARGKAKRAGLDVAFNVAAAQELPFQDASFDVVLNTLALHHLPKPSRYLAFGEIRRVLKPGGRALIVDFAEGKKRPSGSFGWLRHRHGSVPPNEIASAMRAAGFEIAATGSIGVKNLHFVLSGPNAPSMREEAHQAVQVVLKTYVAVAAVALVVGLALLHVAAGATIVHAARSFDATWLAIGAVTVATIAAKGTWLRRRHRND